MSSVESGVWRIPRYYTVEASGLLANEEVMPLPHGPSFHANRTYRELVPQSAFDGATVLVGGVPGKNLPNGADTERVAVWRVPKGAVSLDRVRIYLLENTGAVGAGDLFIASAVQVFGDGHTVVAIDETPVETAFPAEGPTRVARLIEQLVSALPATLDDILHLGVRRNANAVQDTFEDDVLLMGLWLDWTVDE